MSNEVRELRTRAEAAEAQALERNEIFRMLGLPVGDFGALEKYAQAKQDAEALVGELREPLLDLQAIMKDSHGVAGYHLNGDVFEWSEGLDPLAPKVNAALAKTPADMGAEMARLQEENANLAEGIVKACAQLTEAENQALGGQDLVDALRARVAELETELVEARRAGSLMAKECGEAQADLAAACAAREASQ